MSSPGLCAGGAGADFLEIRTSARASAMGGAFVSLAADLSCLQWNPAGLSLLTNPTLEFNHIQHFADTRYEYLSAGLPLASGGALGASYHYSGVDDLFVTNAYGYEKKASAYDMVGTIGCARELREGLFLGGSAKYYHSALVDYDAQGFAFDIGALYGLSDRLRIGCSVLNIGPDIKYKNVGDPLPRWLKAGFAVLLEDYAHGNWSLSTELNKALFEGRRSYVGLGLEYSLIDSFFARLGCRSGAEEGRLSCGVGLKHKGVSYSYAYIPYGPLGDSHSASLALEFGR